MSIFQEFAEGKDMSVNSIPVDVNIDIVDHFLSGIKEENSKVETNTEHYNHSINNEEDILMDLGLKESTSNRAKILNSKSDMVCVLEELELEQDEENVRTSAKDCDDTDDPDYAPERVEEDHHYSDTDIDLSSGDENYGEDTAGIRFHIGRDEETIWASNTVAVPSKTRATNIVKTLPSPKRQARQCKTRLECFSLIFTSETIEHIVRCTNIYIHKKKTEREIHAAQKGDSIRERDYKPTTKAEISAVFGALFLIGVRRGNQADFSEYFSKNGTGLMILRANFSENRFRFLLQSMRFDDVNSRAWRSANDKLAPIRQLVDSFNSNSQNSFTLGPYTTIDEMLVAFRGRCGFVQYMAQKPAKYGLKIYAMCDAYLFYTYNLEIYCGKQHAGPYKLSNRPYDLVMRLVKCIENSNRNVTMDNYFTSYPLAESLLHVGITCLGSMRKNKKEIPPEFITVNKNSVPGSYMFGCQEDKTLVSMVTKKKKAVIVLSTMHDSDTKDPETNKPIQIVDYNITKGGVDTVDLMCSRISTSRQTQRWPMVIFFRLLDLAGINSHRIFQFNSPGIKNNSRREYLYELALELMAGNLKNRSKMTSLPKDLLVFLEKYKEVADNEPVQQVRRGICYICGSHKNNRTKLECQLCHKNVCKHHSSIATTCNNCQDNQNEDMDVD